MSSDMVEDLPSPSGSLEQLFGRMPPLVGLDSSLAELLSLLAQKNGSWPYALVVDAGRVVGILTPVDVLRWVASDRSWQGSTLAEVMTTPVVTLAVGNYRDPLALLELMRAHGIRHLPVVDEAGSLLGVVNQDELCWRLTLGPPPSAAVWREPSTEKLDLPDLQTTLNLRVAIERAIPLGIAAVNSQGRQIYVNETFATMVGWPKEELIGKDPPFVYWPPEEMGKITAAFAQGRPPQGWELTFRRRSGERFPVRILEAPWLDAQGKVIGMIVSVQDLTPEKELQNQQQQLQHSLQYQQDLFQSLFEQAPVGMAVTDAAGHLLKVNQSFCQLTGYTEAELLSMNYADITHPEDLRQEAIYVEEIQAGRRRGYRMEKRYIRKSGEIRWVDLSSFVAETPEKQIYGVVSIVDISERKQAQEQVQLQLHQARLLSHIVQGIRQSLQVESILSFAVEEVRRLLDVERVVIYRFFPDWVGEIAMESVSRPELSLLGLVIEDRCFVTQWHQAYQQGRISAIEDIDTAPIQPCHRELLASLGVRANLVVPILQSAGPDGTDGRLARLWGLLIAHQCSAPKKWDPWMPDFLRQIADQLGLALQQAELFEQLQAANAELRYQVEVRNAELAQRVRYEQMLRLIGDKVRSSLDEQEILATVVRELTQAFQLGACGVALIHPETQTYTLVYEAAGSLPPIGQVTLPLDPVLLRQLRQGQTLYFSTDHPLRGRCTFLACPLFVETGSLLGFLKLVRLPQEGFIEAEIHFAEQVATQCSIAIRQARLYQEIQAQLRQLQRLNELKEEFLSMVSHELRTPLTNMKMALKMLEVRGLSEAQIPYFHILKQEWQKELDLVNDLLDLQRLEAGSRSLEIARFEVREWLEKLVPPFALRFQERRLTFVSRIPSEPILFSTDVGLLTRILSELLANAAKYTPAGQQVYLEVAGDSSGLHLQVINTGVEIPAEHLPRIFEKFHRIPQLDYAHQGGTGLGLPLVKKAVELLQGILRVESGENRTLFAVSLPDLGSSALTPSPSP
ncbi:PAS domain S-box protein [Synechococcus sp. B60.1]|uniref:PAS domain S-box protein n=1 Tax=Synechococcus sp. B60.1 TaxID=2964522 RepID=UPI0039C1C954